jgi:hypothetical protein
MELPKPLHDLKTWPDVFKETLDGEKTHEYRKNDRDFGLGDELLLREFEPIGETYTGSYIRAIITNIHFGPHWGIPAGYAVMSIRVELSGYDERLAACGDRVSTLEDLG